MSDFVHLHVASGYSLRYGASHPAQLVAGAVAQGQDALALTDRDGAYAAVGFAMACREAGISPILGVDLAVATTGDPGCDLPGGGGPGDPGVGSARSVRTPARGGSSVDPGLPRVVLLAQGSRGWGSLCRTISAAHLTGERGRPCLRLSDCRSEVVGLTALLGPDSDVGRALAARRPDRAEQLLAGWRAVFGDRVRIELVSHRARERFGRGPAVVMSTALAARMLGFARHTGVPAVLSNAVRYADRAQAPVADVLDAVRRLVPLDLRHLDRPNSEGYLKGGAQMRQVADEVVRAAGLGTRSAVSRLMAQTLELADACRIDPAADLGIGTVHVPELDVLFPAGLPVGAGDQPDPVASLAGGGPAPATLQAQMADRVLLRRCRSALDAGFTTTREHRAASERLEAELATIAGLGYGGYFLTVAEVVDLIREMGVRVAARGSGAGSLVNYLLGISGVNPLEHGLIMERFLSPLRQALPDIDIDVESARRTEIYTRVLQRFGGERCVCVSMMETYRVRHAIRDVGAALGLPPGEIDAFAKAFPHIRARDARAALQDLPELRRSGLGRLAAQGRLSGFLDLVEGLDGLPRHVALHPCGVLLSDSSLLDRTPVEASWMGFPMSQFDKDAVEEMGFLKLDVLGIRMQSAMAHALDEMRRIEQEDEATGAGSPDPALPRLADMRIDLDRLALDDPATFAMIRTTHTLGCFQIESPGQRELIGKFAPETFEDLIIDISLFRPGPVKSDMVTPFLRARQGWAQADLLHEDLRPVLAQTHGVVVFHEQVIQTISTIAGCTLAQADEARRDLGSPEGQARTRAWFYPRALSRGYDLEVVERVWDVLRAFASFGFCKAHAAAFALPTYHSAWLKAHHPAAFLAGVLTHDPGMYPKRLILDDARNLGISILGPDVNVSAATYRVERCQTPHLRPSLAGLPDGSPYGIRLPLTEVHGVTAAEVERMLAGQPYASLSDFWQRANVAVPVVEGLILTGAFDRLYGIDVSSGLRGRDQVTRRDLLLQLADLDRLRRSDGRGARTPPRGRGALTRLGDQRVPGGGSAGSGITARFDPARAAAMQSQAPAAVRPAAVQLPLALDQSDHLGQGPSGLPEMSQGDAVRAELDLLGMDVSHHVMDFYRPMLADMGVVPARDLLSRRSDSEVWVAGVKVATQTPPIRTGHRVVFLTLDDSTGPIDATFFEAAQEPYAETVFGGWLLLVRGELRRTGPRGVSVQATGCWDLGCVHEVWKEGGAQGVREYISGFPLVDIRLRRRVQVAGAKPTGEQAASGVASGIGRSAAGGMGQRRRVLVHASGFRQSPYADVKPPGEDPAAVPRGPAQGPGAGPGRSRAPGKLWHASPGSSGW